MAQWIKAPDVTPADLRAVPGTHKYYRLSSDLHTCATVYAHTYMDAQKIHLKNLI